MITLLTILSFAGLAFFLKNSSLLDKARIFLIRLHPIFFELFSCYFCLGCWCGMIVYLITTPIHSIGVSNLFIYCFSGGISSLFINSAIEKLQS